MTAKKISPMKIAGVYIGTVVGAGFASGQEILQFFCVFESKGRIGIGLATILFILFGYIIMNMGHNLGSKSHIEIIKETGGKYIGSVVDYVITFFLFGALTSMIAGAGAMFEENFGIPFIWGNVIMAAATLITVMTGVRGVINSISFIVPFLLIAVLSVGLSTIFLDSKPSGEIMAAVESSALIKSWVWAALLYASYNIILSVSILGPLGANAASKHSIRRGALLGGLGLGVSSMVICIALQKYMPSVSAFEIPMVYISRKIGFVAQLAYAIVLLLEVYTTAVGGLFGFVSRLADIESVKASFIASGSVLLALLASQFGFSNIVKYLYPIIGYVGLLFLFLLFYNEIKNVRRRMRRMKNEYGGGRTHFRGDY